MTKTLRRFALVAVICAFFFALASCGGVSQKYADKINEAQKNGEPLSFAEIEKKCGDATFDLRGAGTGVVTWIKGVSAEDWKKMTENANNGVEDAFKKAEGKDSITVTFFGGKATGAVFQPYEKDK